MSVSRAHFEKSLPHFSIMQARKFASHRLRPLTNCFVVPVPVPAVDVESAASRAARWARISSANVLAELSDVADDAVTVNSSLKLDDLF